MPSSPWTETDAGINLNANNTHLDTGASDPSYLTNSDKADLVAQWASELAIKTQLDTLAGSLGASSVAYDNAVAAINTTLVNAGAPSNWATIWPDGTTFGPVVGIKTLLTAAWAEVSSQRSYLQGSIGNYQAAAAKAEAIAAALKNTPAVVSSLPNLPNADSYPIGKMVFNSTDGKLYTNVENVWTALKVGAVDISGTLSAAQIASVAASQVTGTLSDSQLAAISAAKVTGTITASQIASGAVGMTQLASSIRPTRVVSSLPVSPWTGYTAGDTVVLTTDSKLYRFTGSAWTNAVATSDLFGTISASQIAANSITAAQIAADTITSGQIAVGAITASELAAGAVTATSIAANTITGINIAAATITGSNLVSDTITATQIAANAITASELAAGSVVAGKIAAGTVQASDIAASAITGDKIAANTITASNIASGTITASQIAADTITSGQIAAGAITASELAAGSINASKLEVGAAIADIARVGTLTAQYIYFTDGFCLNTLEPKEAGANVTAAHVLTASVSQGTGVAISTSDFAEISGFGFTVTAQSTSDVFNIYSVFVLTSVGNMETPVFQLRLDNTTTKQSMTYTLMSNTTQCVSFVGSVTGLSAGTHTLKFYSYTGGPGGCQFSVGSYALCQRIY